MAQAHRAAAVAISHHLIRWVVYSITQNVMSLEYSVSTDTRAVRASAAGRLGTKYVKSGRGLLSIESQTQTVRELLQVIIRVSCFSLLSSVENAPKRSLELEFLGS